MKGKRGSEDKKGANEEKMKEKSLRRGQDSERKDVDETKERFGRERTIRSEI